MNAFLMVFGLLRLTGYATDPLLDSAQVHAIVGEPSRIGQAPPADGRLTVVSWNIAQGARYERVRDALAAWTPTSTSFRKWTWACGAPTTAGLPRIWRTTWG